MDFLQAIDRNTLYNMVRELVVQPKQVQIQPDLNETFTYDVEWKQGDGLSKEN